MSIAFVLLISVLAMSVGLALLLTRRLSEMDALPDSKTLEADIARLEGYRDFRRLGFENVAEGRRLMRRQLIELRRDFLRLWRICRLLAPYAEDPEFGMVLVKQLALFYRLWVPLWIGTYGWRFEGVVRNVTKLGDAVEILRRCAHAATEGAERASFESATG